MRHVVSYRPEDVGAAVIGIIVLAFIVGLGAKMKYEYEHWKQEKQTQTQGAPPDPRAAATAPHAHRTHKRPATQARYRSEE